MRLLGTRQWYEQSLLLWVVARSCLRYLPYPYPSVSTVQSKLVFLVLTMNWHWKPKYIQPRTVSWSFNDFEIELAGALHSWKTPC